jgi:predicted RNase H-like HicB family nuclease
MGMSELIVVVEEAPEGGYTARALGESIFTEGETIAEIRANVLDAIRCHYPEEDDRPKLVRLHLVKDEILPV